MQYSPTTRPATSADVTRTCASANGAICQCCETTSSGGAGITRWGAEIRRASGPPGAREGPAGRARDDDVGGGKQVVRHEVDRDLAIASAARGPPADLRYVEDRLARAGPEEQVSRRDRGAGIRAAGGARLERERGRDGGEREQWAGVHAGCTTRAADEVPANCVYSSIS